MNSPSPPSPPAPGILVVDDQQESADALSELLELLGYRTRVAYDGDAALAAVQAQRPDVVIMDLHMPMMGGVAACTRLRRQESGTPMTIIALTGSTLPADREAAELAGFDHFLVKPVMLAALVRLLPSLPSE